MYCLAFLLIYPKIPNYREEIEEEDEEDEQQEDAQPLVEELPIQEEVKEEVPVVQQEEHPILNDMNWKQRKKRMSRWSLKMTAEKFPI